MTRKQQITEAARDIFVAEGPQGLTMRRVAERVGVSATALYRHFENRDHLLKAVVDHGRDRFASYLIRALGEPTPRRRLLSTGERYLDYGFENSHDYKIMFSSWEHLTLGLHTPDDRVANEHAPMFRFLLDRVRECATQIDDGRLFELGFLFWAQCHGLVMIFLTGAGRQMMPFEAYRTLCGGQLELLLSALLPRPDATQPKGRR